MVTLIVILQLIIVLTMIFIGGRIGGIGMGIYGMVGVFILPRRQHFRQLEDWTIW